MGSFKRKKYKTYDLNPSSIAQKNKPCKKMGENPRRTPSLEKASHTATTTPHKIMAT
jgi:hypothetical protein